MDSSLQRSIHGPAGILGVRFRDPFSQLLSAIRDCPFHAIGFYYAEQERPKHNVILFNSYDNRPVPWLELGCSLEHLYASIYLERIECYELNPSLSLSEFRAAIIEVINLNAPMIGPPDSSYRQFLEAAAGLTPDGSAMALITGYTLVNQVLLKLDPDPAKAGLDPFKLDPATIQMTLATTLLESRWIQIPRELPLALSRTKDRDRTDVLSLSQAQINGLIQHFGELWNQDSRFRDAVDTSWNPEILTRFRPTNWSPEHDLIIDSEALEMAAAIPDRTAADLALADLGQHLTDLVGLWDNPEPLILDLGSLIGLYNRAIDSTALPPIVMASSSQPGVTRSRTAILTLPDTDANLSCLIGSETITIPMHHPDLSNLSRTNLIGLLIYIDSLTANPGTETRYANLQNQIVHELALRSVNLKIR